MDLRAWVRRRRGWMLVALAATVLAVVVSAEVPAAALVPPAVADPEVTDDEGGTPTLREQLEKAARGYNEAKVKLDASRRKQATLLATKKVTDISLIRLTASVGAVSSARYKGSTLSTWNGLLDQRAPEDVLQGMAISGYLTWRDDEQLRLLGDTQRTAKSQAAALNAEIKEQEKQFAEMDRQKRNAEKALAAVGGMVTAGFTGAVPEAQPTRRNADGGLPSEGCTVNDPTTTGCISGRTYHMLSEARLAGFTRYVSCFRPGGSGEHPRGKACDFASAPNGFLSYAAVGDDRTYGNRLAAWGVKNAYALGVLYVIWYRQIWMPGLGWRGYSGYGSAAASHTNHVHISMQ